MKRNNYIKMLIVALACMPALALADTAIHMQIEGPERAMYAGELSVSPCVPDTAEASTTPALETGYCALEQAGLDIGWSAYGDDFFLDSIQGIANDFAGNVSWSWFSNLEFGQTSLYKHVLVPGETLLVTYGKMPLRLDVSSTSPTVHATTTITVQEFGFDAAWNAVWSPSAESQVAVGADIFTTNAEGRVEFAASTTDELAVSASKPGYITAQGLRITPVPAGQLSTSTDTGSTTEEVPGNSGNGGSSQDAGEMDISGARSFLRAQQKDDGSFGSLMHTDWVALAASAARDTSLISSLKAYFKSSSVRERDLDSATDYERHAMALMSLGIHPYSGTSINYIDKILSFYDGEQVGDRGLVNDDIFALFPLRASGYSADDDEVEHIVKYIVSQQEGDGSWERSVDLTAAAVQALELVAGNDGVGAALAKASGYLQAAQQPDGGFGSIFSTAWVLQSGVLSEGQAQKAKHYMHDQQAEDGGMLPSDADMDTRLWATSYAVPAALEKKWISILDRVSKPVAASRQESEKKHAEDPNVAVQFVATSTAPVAVPVIAPEPVVQIAATGTNAQAKIISPAAVGRFERTERSEGAGEAVTGYEEARPALQAAAAVSIASEQVRRGVSLPVGAALALAAIIIGLLIKKLVIKLNA